LQLRENRINTNPSDGLQIGSEFAIKEFDSPLTIDGTSDEDMKRDQSELEIEIPRRIFEVNTVFDKKDRDRRFMSNKITTSRYNCLTFLPKNMFEQLSKMANFYFLIMGLMELYKPISDSNGLPIMLLPLSFVMSVAMIKDLLEDNSRKKADHADNIQLVECCPRGEHAFREMR